CVPLLGHLISSLELRLGRHDLRPCPFCLLQPQRQVCLAVHLCRDAAAPYASGIPNATCSIARRCSTSDQSRPPIKPPSTTKAWPLTKLDSSLASQSPACAMS